MKSVNQLSGVDAGRASALAVQCRWFGATHRERWASGIGRMKALLTIFLLLVCVSAQAHRIAYSSYREFVERNCSTITTPRTERVFVGCAWPQKYLDIVDFQKGITLRDIIDQTPLKGNVVYVMVLRPETPFSPDYVRVGRHEKPRYKIKALDVIWLSDAPPSGIEL